MLNRKDAVAVLFFLHSGQEGGGGGGRRPIKNKIKSLPLAVTVSLFNLLQL